MSVFAGPAILCAALLCAPAHAEAPAYDGRTPMVETGPVWFDPALSAECTLYFAGTDRCPFSTPGKHHRKEGAGFTFTFPAVVVLGQPRSFTGGVLKHEMSHMEFRARLHGASVPAWFNEGVASYVGGEHDSFCRPGMKGIDDLFELDRGPAWLAYTNQHRDKSRMTYCQARNEVGDWIAEHGGFAEVLDLLAQRAKGTPFASLYGRERERVVAAASSPTVKDDDDTD